MSRWRDECIQNVSLEAKRASGTTPLVLLTRRTQHRTAATTKHSKDINRLRFMARSTVQDAVMSRTDRGRQSMVLGGTFSVEVLATNQGVWDAYGKFKNDGHVCTYLRTGSWTPVFGNGSSMSTRPRGDEDSGKRQRCADVHVLVVNHYTHRAHIFDLSSLVSSCTYCMAIVEMPRNGLEKLVATRITRRHPSIKNSDKQYYCLSYHAGSTYECVHRAENIRLQRQMFVSLLFMHVCMLGSMLVQEGKGKRMSSAYLLPRQVSSNVRFGKRPAQCSLPSSQNQMTLAHEQLVNYHVFDHAVHSDYYTLFFIPSSPRKFRSCKLSPNHWTCLLEVASAALAWRSPPATGPLDSSSPVYRRDQLVACCADRPTCHFPCPKMG